MGEEKVLSQNNHNTFVYCQNLPFTMRLSLFPSSWAYIMVQVNCCSTLILNCWITGVYHSIQTGLKKNIFPIAEGSKVKVD